MKLSEVSECMKWNDMKSQRHMTIDMTWREIKAGDMKLMNVLKHNEPTSTSMNMKLQLHDMNLDAWTSDLGWYAIKWHGTKYHEHGM